MHVPRMDTVSQIQTKLAEKLGPQKFKIWFKNATQFTLSDAHLKVSTPNQFICNWLERNYADLIVQCVREATGQECQISFVLDARLQHALRKHQLDSQADFIAKNPERIAREARRQQAPIPPRSLKGRFDELVVGPSNELAVSVVRQVAERSPTAYSPIFLHGGCGLGKTHILQALGNELAEKHPEVRWEFVTGDDFTNAFVGAVRSNSVESFRQRYRHLDVLIIDDVQFLAGKKATQEEFLHTFNAIESMGKHVVIASDSHPKLIGQFSEQLLNRFIAGMVVKIDVPDFRMRCDILRRRARLATNRPVPEDVIAWIAERLVANVRELEGALLKLLMFSNLARQPITLSLAQRALADHLQRTQRFLGLDEIDQAVATYFGLTSADLHTSRKTRTIALARGIAMYLARKHTDMSFPEIGRFMGNKNHSTVILANRKIQEMLEQDAVVARQTPAGLKEEKIREIVQRLEEQLGKSSHGMRVRAEMQGLALLEPTRTPASTPPASSSGRAAI